VLAPQAPVGERSPDLAVVSLERPAEPAHRLGGSNAGAVLELQRSAGNRSVTAVLAARRQEAASAWTPSPEITGAAAARVARCPDTPNAEPCDCERNEDDSSARSTGDGAESVDRLEAALRRAVMMRHAETSQAGAKTAAHAGGRCPCGGTILPGGECSRCLARRLASEGQTTSMEASAAIAREALAATRSLSRDAQGPRERLDRQAADDAPRRPNLNPADPHILEAIETAEADRKTDSLDPRCEQASGPSPSWMPNVAKRLPIKLGEGTRRSPRLKDPDAPGAAKCRGACGPDCPPTCKPIETYVEQYAVGDCTYVIEFPNPLLCGTHAGCRDHDACFDAAVASGETQMGGPLHKACNADAGIKHPLNVASWARGGGPYDNWFHFVDNPVIRKSTSTKSPAERAPAQPR
jgi:hypothetical protein